jgi:hypothetical protein
MNKHQKTNNSQNPKNKISKQENLINLLRLVQIGIWTTGICKLFEI